MANPKAPYLHHVGEHCIVFPFDANGKVINITVSETKIQLDEDSIIEIVSPIVSKTPSINDMMLNISPLENGTGYKFGVPNEFWANIFLKDGHIHAIVKDRFNKCVLEEADLSMANA